jgi:hypothetical protein
LQWRVARHEDHEGHEGHEEHEGHLLFLATPPQSADQRDASIPSTAQRKAPEYKMVFFVFVVTSCPSWGDAASQRPRH